MGKMHSDMGVVMGLSISKKGVAVIALIGLVAAGLFACGGGSDSSTTSAATPTDPGTPTTLVSSANGQSTVTCAQNQQCIDPYAAALLQLPPALSVVATPWTNTSTNIITNSLMPYVSGSNPATTYDPAGSIFAVTSDPIAGTRTFKGNGLPTTLMGTFPVQSGTAAYPYYAALPGGTDPTTGIAYSSAAAIGVSTYNLTSTIPLNPVPTGFYPINSGIIGITLTGAVWHIEVANDANFNYYNPVNALPVDQCWGHPYYGQYHHHGYSWKCFPNQGTSGPSPIFGYALDGFGIYGPRGEDGQMITNAQLDQCHGHTALVMWNGSLQSIYHYHLNREYPYSVGCFRGKVNYDIALGPSGNNTGMKNGVPGYINAPYP
jgi:YHYH protein